MNLALVRIPVFVALTAVVTLLIARPAPAATITVAAGSVDATADGQCSLVEAIRNANADSTAGSVDCAAGSGADTIQLASAGTYEVTTFTNTFFGFTGLPVITSEITVEGAGSTIARGAAAPPLRLLNVDTTGKLTLRNTVLSSGLALGGDGGNDSGTDDGGGGGGGAGLGGAVYNRGVLALTRTTLSGNTARGGEGGDSGNNAANDDGGGAGGGGLGGDGGNSNPVVVDDGGNGGGGFGGNGAVGGVLAGGGGGGSNGNGSPGGGVNGGPGGLANGGDGADDGFAGQAGGLGGGGGGGGEQFSGGDGGLGGGGGGAGELNAFPVFPKGGDGGFGGGGGGGGEEGSGGDGGFGGGGGGSHNTGAPITSGQGGFGGGDAGAESAESGGGGGGAGMGGAVFNDGGAVTVLNSTFSGNTAAGGTGGAGTPGAGQPGQAGRGLGGGIFNRNGSVTVTETTFAGNAGEGGGIYARQANGQPSSLSLRNSIVADSAASAVDCIVDGTVVTTGSVTNLVELNSGCAGVTVGGDPRLGTIGLHGGLTPNFEPAIGSPAVNAASDDACTGSDQRGKPRPVGSACDQGSVEIAPQVKRKVTIKYKDGKGAFTGKVKADVNACQKGKVSIFRSAPGSDPKVAKGKAKGGKYTADEGDPENGKYYAKLKQTQANEITCLKAKSKKTSV